MPTRKERLTVTVDHAVVRAAKTAVARGHAPSLSGWVNVALAERVAKERRLRAMGDVIAAYEAEFGEISSEELDTQRRADRRAAVVVSAPARQAGPPRRRRRAA